MTELQEPATAGSAPRVARWDTRRWDDAVLGDINSSGSPEARRRRKWATDVTAPVSALYIFASETEAVIRPGAIGVHRAFNQDAGAFADTGNSALNRFRQYNDSNSKAIYPWRARPWRYIWIRQFVARDISLAELGIAEQVLHFHIAAAGFRFLGSSCHRCNDVPSAIQVAELAVERFQKVAPALFG